MKFSRIIALFLILTTLSIFGTAFAAPPTTRDLNVNYDATNGTTREGYIDSFK
jgi:hypothetical protein